MIAYRQVPSAVTLLNAAAGFIACACAVTGKPELASLAVLAAVLMDALDGALARSFDATSDMGAELDSLADAISFGVAPAVLVGSVLPEHGRMLGWALLAVFPLCAVWRLARYNVEHTDDEAQSSTFEGLPSTGAGAASATATLLYVRSFQDALPYASLCLTFIMVALGALMVSRLPYRHAGSLISRLSPFTAIVLAVGLVGGSVLWRYDYVFAALMWTYVVSAPLSTATGLARAERHA